jgi:uncharacterized protein YdhG (YjbR/CyaY superfamily)
MQTSVIETYILDFPVENQLKLRQMYAIIKNAAPNTQEKISYGMPTFVYHGILVHFAGYKNHIGFYPTPSTIDKFKSEISRYKWAKGSVQFPLDQELPEELNSKMVQFRVEENQNKTTKKR